MSELRGAHAMTRISPSEVYYATYVLLSKVGSRGPASAGDAHKGVIGITAVEGFLSLAFLALASALVHRRLDLRHWGIWAWYLGLLAVNYYFLVFRGDGVRFAEQQHLLSQSKRSALRVVSIATLCAVAIFAAVSGVIYRETVHA